MYYNQGPTYERNRLDPECSGNRDFVLHLKNGGLLAANNRPSLDASSCCDINGNSLGLQKCSESTATCGVVGPTKQARGETTLAPCMQCFGLSVYITVTPLTGLLGIIYDYKFIILFVILVIVLLIFCICKR